MDIGVNNLTKNINEFASFVDKFTKSSLNIRDEIIKEQQEHICIISLIRDTYMCNLIYRYIGVMLITNDNPIWVSLDNIMTVYIKKYYSSKLSRKLTTLYNYYNEKSQNYCKFLDKIIYRCNMTKKSIKTKETIKMIENKIFNILNVSPIIKVSNVKQLNFELKNNNYIVHLTQDNYNILIDNIDDIDLLHSIETQYISRTENVLSDFAQLIILRHILAQQNEKHTYFEYINVGKQNITKTIKLFLSELNNNINYKFANEINKIYQVCGKNKKLQHSDILKYIRSKKNKNKYNIQHVINIIFNLLDTYFNIIIKKTNSIWRNLDSYIVYDKPTNKLLGRLFIDINQNYKLNTPITIIISDKMQINNTNDIQQDMTVSEIVLISNYVNITYDEIVLLFREFGHIITNMCYTSCVGLVNYDIEFTNFVPTVMEYFAYDREIMKSITKDDIVCDHIEMHKNIDICYQLKIKCINAQFDHMMHNSEELINKIINSYNKNKTSPEIFQTYQNIFEELMQPIYLLYNIKIQHIDPLLIIQEINSFQGLLYSNLMNDIFAYGSYWIIKNKNYGNVFRSTILNNGTDNYRELIRNFLSTHNINCFTLFSNNIIKIESVNMYTDKNSFEEHEDIDEIY